MLGTISEEARSQKANGASPFIQLEIPMGPCCSFTTPGAQRVAVYELSRHEVRNTSSAAGISKCSTLL